MHDISEMVASSSFDNVMWLSEMMVSHVEKI